MIQQFRKPLPPNVRGYVVTDSEDAAIVLNAEWAESLDRAGDTTSLSAFVDELLAEVAVSAR